MIKMILNSLDKKVSMHGRSFWSIDSVRRMGPTGVKNTQCGPLFFLYFGEFRKELLQSFLTSVSSPVSSQAAQISQYLDAI